MHARQTAKLIARIAENLPDMSPNVMQDWIEDPRALKYFLAGLCPQGEGVVLTPGDEFIISGGPLGESFKRGFNPHEFFKTRPGLRVSPEFTDLVLSVADQSMEVWSSKIRTWDLRKAATNIQIRDKLPGDHLVGLGQIANIIDRQPSYWANGCGPVLINGYPNLFYVSGKSLTVFAVSLYRFAVGDEWDIETSKLWEGGEWPSGVQVITSSD